ncbi:MAG: hypothetical protein JRI23_28815 [Deltaproteobacteria bacterium]|jgi:hypothetical protein|nr:hypothetical protein [Deltaproteobacteria bacterium]MBW2536121.1 hypothetical protein [Deltaproteobacteria bacterium]
MKAPTLASLLAATALAACTARPGAFATPEPTPTTTGEPAASASPASTTTATTTPDTPALERTRTEQKQPTVVVDNGYPVRQHVFIDGQPVGQVEAGSRETFEMAPGVHTVTCSDSADPDDNPSSVTEPFEVGFGYRYRIVAK